MKIAARVQASTTAPFFRRRQQSRASIAQRFPNRSPKRDDKSRAADFAFDVTPRWIPRHNPPARYQFGHSSGRAVLAARQEKRTREPYRIAWFQRAGCLLIRCLVEKLFAEHREAARAPCVRR